MYYYFGYCKECMKHPEEFFFNHTGNWIYLQKMAFLLIIHSQLCSKLNDVKLFL